MNKQYFIGIAGILAVFLLFFLGRTSEKKSSTSFADPLADKPGFNIQDFIAKSKLTISPSQALYITKLENNISRGDILTQEVTANESLANFWKDSLRAFEPYLFYLSKAAKLDNSEKKLTFAARIFLEGLRGEQDAAKLSWLTNEAISLYESAIKLNPEEDELKIGLGSCYIYGKGRSGNPQETMQGIQLLLSVARKDTNNMKAQMVLGVGGLVSGQFDKALERFQKVVSKEPGNLEAIAYLADAHAAKGNKTEAIKWYEISKRLANDPHYTEEVNNRINSLR